ncbi:hypothetical protein JTE90_010041 [Oedothorax gibbosus]|uniref:Uncharacterized protein n=1 Tax=Oedothorax gibbosus TaxID=931172 RepID=A0AAV6V4T2_9ARAC|nr:hypothetical protein JTE90_010041 [Oedothorax gibbosus]
MAKKVKAGEAEDSLYVKNLAVGVGKKQELANRSVCGFRRNDQESVARKVITPEKLDFIKNKFKENCCRRGCRPRTIREK